MLSCERQFQFIVRLMHGGIPFMVFSMFRPFPVYLSEHLGSLQLNYIAACFHLTLRTNTTPSSYTRICAHTHTTPPAPVSIDLSRMNTAMLMLFHSFWGKTHTQIYTSINNGQQRLVCNKVAIPFFYTVLKAKKTVKKYEMCSKIILIKTFWGENICLENIQS